MHPPVVNLDVLWADVTSSGASSQRTALHRTRQMVAT